MPVMNCKKCGSPFGAGPNEHLCPSCRDEEMKVFQRVREYIRAHPGATAEDIALGTGIDERTILRFMNQGRLLRK